MVDDLPTHEPKVAFHSHTIVYAKSGSRVQCAKFSGNSHPGPLSQGEGVLKIAFTGEPAHGGAGRGKSFQIFGPTVRGSRSRDKSKADSGSAGFASPRA